MNDNSSHVPSQESILDSQLTENKEILSVTEEPTQINQDQQEISQTSQLESESKSTCSKQKNIDWQKLAHKLREHNRKLLKRVFTLEQEVAEAQNKCKEQNDQFITNDLLVKQQAEKLTDHQEEVAHLLQEIETTQQQLQEKQALANNLSQQLEISQQETAKMERQCTKLQDANNEKDYQIAATNKQIQELQNRLDRQQQNTIKYRAALEKYISTGDFPTQSVPSSSFPRISNSEPIKAWSEANGQSQKPMVASDLPEATENLSTSPLLTKKEATSKKNNWPAPEIATANKENQPKSIAAVQLPSFPRKSSS